MAIGRINLAYPTIVFPFRELVSDALGGHALEDLHELEAYGLLKRENDQSTTWHKRFYEMTASNPEWTATYREFIAYLKGYFDETLVYQRVPTFRVALPGNVGVGEWHRDRDYSHSPHEINVWVPLTAAQDTSAVWCETAEGMEDYRPLNCAYGDALIFDAANLKHGNKLNETGQTRVSFDLRIIPLSLYAESTDRFTINTKLRFAIGDDAYFAVTE